MLPSAALNPLPNIVLNMRSYVTFTMALFALKASTTSATPLQSHTTLARRVVYNCTDDGDQGIASLG